MRMHANYAARCIFRSMVKARLASAAARDKLLLNSEVYISL